MNALTVKPPWNHLTNYQHHQFNLNQKKEEKKKIGSHCNCRLAPLAVAKPRMYLEEFCKELELLRCSWLSLQQALLDVSTWPHVLL